MYSTPNILHVFHNKINLKEALVNQLIDGTDALTWISENIPDFVFPSLDIFFCIKHQNAGKIESHLWFFKGFCNYLNPHMCQLIDTGTIPMQDSISRIFMYMDTYTNVGGGCGEIEVMFPPKPEGFLQMAVMSG